MEEVRKLYRGLGTDSTNLIKGVNNFIKEKFILKNTSYFYQCANYNILLYKVTCAMNTWRQ